MDIYSGKEKVFDWLKKRVVSNNLQGRGVPEPVADNLSEVVIEGKPMKQAAITWLKTVVFTAGLTAALAALEVLRQAMVDGIVTGLEWREVLNTLISVFFGAILLKRPVDHK